MLRRVQQLGMLRRVGNPEPDLLEELFRSSVARMACSKCGQVGLQESEQDDPEWGDERCCEVCGKMIPAERLQALPHARRCVHCESDS